MVDENRFYRDYYDLFIQALFIMPVLIFLMVALVFYQLSHRPRPLFFATALNGQQLELSSFDEPNLMPDTITTFASKAAVAAYTFDFVNFNKQIQGAHPYFTDAGWDNYQNSISGLIDTITKNQLFVNGVVVGPPVISNQGDLPGSGYAWRVQLPFLVTYQSADATTQTTYKVNITIVRVSPDINPTQIGIDRFVMK